MHPNAHDLAIIQDKYAQKAYLQSKDIPVESFCEINDAREAERCGQEYGYPFMLKCRRLAYDGRGNAIVHSESEIDAQMAKLGGVDLYAEKLVPFVKELAVMVVRSKEGVFAYPAVETVQRNGVCHVVIAPAQVSATARAAAESVAMQVGGAFQGYGVFGVELFLLDDDTVLVNEVAPR
jgi:phosphoribosylaminoimidazole carboxylase